MKFFFVFYSKLKFFKQGPPEVWAERVQWGHQGDTVLVECRVRATSPRSLSVVWTHRGQEVDTSKFLI